MTAVVKTTWATTQPIATAYAIQSAWNTAKLSASPFYTTHLLVPSTVATDFRGFVVGETGSNGKFGGSVPGESPDLEKKN